jgi:hypothetical protein
MKLLYGVLLFALAQILIWFQSNGQFLWFWFRSNPLLLSLMGGTLISYILINGTRLIAEHYDGLIWPGRFIGFSVGIILFSYLTWQFMNEGINTKTLISIGLSILLICVQIFWK